MPEALQLALNVELNAPSGTGMSGGISLLQNTALVSPMDLTCLRRTCKLYWKLLLEQGFNR